MLDNSNPWLVVIGPIAPGRSVVQTGCSMLCAERVSLQRAVQEADGIFDVVRKRFNSGIGIASRGEFEQLKRAVDMAWENFTTVRTTWEDHVRQHGCLQPAEPQNPSQQCRARPVRRCRSSSGDFHVKAALFGRALRQAEHEHGARRGASGGRALLAPCLFSTNPN